MLKFALWARGHHFAPRRKVKVTAPTWCAAFKFEMGSSVSYQPLTFTETNEGQARIDKWNLHVSNPCVLSAKVAMAIVLRRRHERRCHVDRIYTAKKKRQLDPVMGPGAPRGLRRLVSKISRCHLPPSQSPFKIHLWLKIL